MKTKTMIDKAIGRRIREARVGAGFSQEDLGDACAVTRSSVSLWEKGRAMPTDVNVEQLTEIFKCGPDYLITGRGKKPRKAAEPKVGYRRDMMGRMQRLLATGKFNELIRSNFDALFGNGDFDGELIKRGWRKKRR